MPLVMSTNISSLNAQRHLSLKTAALNKSMERLSSGYRINRAGDDAAGLALSENLRTQIRGSQKALDNVQDGKNMLNIVDGAYQSMTDIVQRMRELTVQAANDTYSPAQRTSIYDELVQNSKELDRIAAGTEFNGIHLLDGSIDGVTQFMKIQLGPNGTANDSLDLSTAAAVNPFADAQASQLRNGNPLNVTGLPPFALAVGNNPSAHVTLSLIDDALDDLNARRGVVGALSNRLDSAAQNLSIGIENLSASEARIRNTDVAQESGNLIRNQVMQQAAAAMLAQANQAPNLVMQLLKAA